MASIPAKEVAMEVIETARKGEKPNLYKIQQKHGYSKTSAKSMNAKRTKTYQETIANDPFVQAMIKERDAAIARMAKVRSKAKYRDLTDAADKLNKNIQLATGGKTDDFGLDSATNSLNEIINKLKKL